MQEFWVRIGEASAFPKGIVKLIKIDNGRAKIRLIPEVDIEEVRRVRGSVVDPVRRRLRAIVTEEARQ